MRFCWGPSAFIIFFHFVAGQHIKAETNLKKNPGRSKLCDCLCANYKYKKRRRKFINNIFQINEKLLLCDAIANVAICEFQRGAFTHPFLNLLLSVISRQPFKVNESTSFLLSCWWCFANVFSHTVFCHTMGPCDLWHMIRLIFLTLSCTLDGWVTLIVFFNQMLKLGGFQNFVCVCVCGCLRTFNFIPG